MKLETARCWCYQRVEIESVTTRNGDMASCDSCTARLAKRILAESPDILEAHWHQTGAASAGNTMATVDIDDSHSAETHADLAAAYLEMHLLTDALISAATSLAIEPTRSALSVVFDRRLLRSSDLRQLRLLVGEPGQLLN